MATVYARAQIEQVIRPAEVVAAMERAFVAYSRREAVVPPVGQMEFANPPGECDIKYGYLKEGSTFTIKIATGFWKNRERGLPPSNGVVLVFSSETGELQAILQDEGYLTDIRTAAAGAVAAKYLAPSEIRCIGIIGAGTQAKLQLEFLKQITDCRRVMLWARSADRARAFHAEDFEITVASSVAELAAHAQLIVTTTALAQMASRRGSTFSSARISRRLVLMEEASRSWNHGSCSLANACVVDSAVQCSEYGDSSFALREGLIQSENLIELGR